MSVLDDLNALDLSAIVSARGQISSAVAVPDLQHLVTAGIGPAALGSFGSDLSALQGLLSGDPAALLAPLEQVLETITGQLHIDVSGDQVLAATKEALQLLSGIVAALQGDMSGLSAALGRSMPSLLGEVTDRIPTSASGAMADLADFARLATALETGTPVDGAAFAELVISATLPFPVATLKTLKARCDGIRASCATMVFPHTRTDGLHTAVAAVTVAAQAGDASGLQRALVNLEQIRVATVVQLGHDLDGLLSTVAGLHLDAVAKEFATLLVPLHTAETGVLDLLGMLRSQLVDAKAMVEAADFAALAGSVDTLLAQLEAEAVAAVEPLITEAVATARDRLGGFLSGLGLRQARDEVLGAVHSVATLLAEHDPRAPLVALHDGLESVRHALDPATLATEVQQALQAIVTLAETALQQVTDALGAVRAGVQAVADQAEAPVAAATDALESLAGGVRSVETTLEQLDIAQIGQSIASTLHGVSQTVQQVTSAIALPDALRPQISALADSISAIDLDAAIEQPVNEALTGLTIPSEAGDALNHLVDRLEHIVPSELLASIEADVNELLDTLTHLHPDIALDALDTAVHDVAREIGQFHLADAAAILTPAYTALHSALTALDPAVLLRPVLDAFDRMSSAISVPHASDVANRLGGAVGSAVDGVGGALTGSLSSLPGVTASAPGAAGTPTTPTSPTVPPAGGTPAVPDVRPGDAIRLLGHLPALVRDALSALDPSVVNTCLQTVDGMTAGLATDLRAVANVVENVASQADAVIFEMVSGLAVPVAQAGFAVSAHLSTGAAWVDVEATLLAVGRAGPAGLIADLAAPTSAALSSIRVEAAKLASTGAALERAATALDRCALSGVTADLSTFLSALDPEPIAAALDDLVISALNRGPELVTGAGTVLSGAVERLRALLERYQPAAVAMRFLPLLQLIDDEIALLNPRALVSEVEDVYQLIVGTIEAFNPATIAADVDGEIGAIVTELQGLHMASLVPDTSFLQPLVDKIEAASPLPALQGVADNLDEVAQRLQQIDLGALISDVNGLGPRVPTAFDTAIEAVKRELLALLDSLQFGSASVSGSVSLGGGTG